MKGPAAANPALAQQTAPQRDRFERRVEDNRARLLAAAATDLAAVASSRRWETLLLVGDPRLTRIVAGALPGTPPAVVEVPRILDGLSAAELAAAVADEFEGCRRRVARAIIARAVEAARSGGLGSAGLEETLAALAEGRVAHLVLEAEREWRGVRAPDGRLAPEGAVLPGTRTEELAEEPRLAERMVEAALATDAEVTLVDGDAAALLEDADGVAAVLRW